MTNLDLSNLLWKELRSIFVDVAIFYLLDISKNYHFPYCNYLLQSDR